MRSLQALCLFTLLLTVAGAQHTASVYDHKFSGKRTASGEIYNPRALTAANRKLPFGTCVAISKGRHTVRVRINDRGPWIKGREFDLSEAAARQLGIVGVSFVSVIIVQKKECL